MAPKIKFCRAKFRRDDVLEITKDIGCIPAGTYVLSGKGEGFYYFGLNETAVFGIDAKCRKYLKRVGVENKPLTSSEEFIKKYYALMAFKSSNPSVGDPKTYCAVDPRALKYLSDGFEGEDKLH